MKEELGLDHFEGRSWKGLRRHALMTLIADAFLQHYRLDEAKREKKNLMGAATDVAGDPSSPGQGLVPHAHKNPRTMSALPNARPTSIELTLSKHC
jgi:hypothetical protein